MCQLDRVQSVCLMRLAERTIGWGSSLPHAIGHASLLKGCNTRILTQLIGIITAAGAHPRSARQQLSMMMPTAEAVRVALAKTANPVRFDYVLEAFAQLPSDVGAVQTSPEFTAAGGWQGAAGPVRQVWGTGALLCCCAAGALLRHAAGHRWTLCVYPGGDSAGAQGYVSGELSAWASDSHFCSHVCISCVPAICLHWMGAPPTAPQTVQVPLHAFPSASHDCILVFLPAVYVRCVDGGANMRASCVVEALTDDGVAGRKRTLHNKPVNSGWSKFTRSGDLAQRGLLPGGSLRLRVTLTLEP